MNRLIGDKAFYKKIIALMLPIMVQNGITNFVNMLDNVMVGRMGTNAMTGVAVSNQLLFVFNLCVFGAVAGAGIFGAQFAGKKDHQGVQYTFRFKLVISLALAVVGTALLLAKGEPLVKMYLQGEGDAASAAESLAFALDYIRIMIIGLVPFALVQCYSGTLREQGQTVLPMVAGVSAVLINLVLNYTLIFGHFGAPALGVEGAAIATVISRFVELAIVAVWTRLNAEYLPFIKGAFRSMYMPADLAKRIAVKGLPLLANEALWSTGVAMVNQCYSVRGLDVVAANNISSTFFNVFSVAFMSVGAAIAIVLGQLLGAGKLEEARLASGRLITFSVMISVVVGILYAFAAQWIPLIYNTTPEVRTLATRLMQITALVFPLDAIANACYFTLRSGGKTFITFVFDCGFTWIIQAPVAFVLSRFTGLPILALFFICQMLNLIKDVVGLTFVKSGTWVRNIVQD